MGKGWGKKSMRKVAWLGGKKSKGRKWGIDKENGRGGEKEGNMGKGWGKKEKREG